MIEDSVGDEFNVCIGIGVESMQLSTTMSFLGTYDTVPGTYMSTRNQYVSNPGEMKNKYITPECICIYMKLIATKYTLTPGADRIYTNKYLVPSKKYRISYEVQNSNHKIRT